MRAAGWSQPQLVEQIGVALLQHAHGWCIVTESGQHLLDEADKRFICLILALPATLDIDSGPEKIVFHRPPFRRAAGAERSGHAAKDIYSFGVLLYQLTGQLFYDDRWRR
ncbi:MAG: hypothetical protein H6668_15660 [Ardenticatenaceae bacterium]|nr:hypothetical protein [Ardenticatenaceae bacterium]